jgi:serine/threonine-protein kinase
VGFTLVEEVGRGGMGVVWRAQDDQTGQVVAIKLLRDLYVEDQSYRQRFEHELEIARRITSAHVVKVLGYGARDGVPYIAFEFVDGSSLRQMLVQHGPYRWDEVRALLLQLAEGLADAHAAGVIHRDVKPSNILVDSTGTAKLADFGISRALDVTRVTKASGVLGTPAYLAPEGPIDARSDLYSLGVVAFELLSGSPPFEGGTYHEVLVAHIRRPPDLTKVPAEARPIVAWLLAKDPNARAQTARQLIRVLTGAEGIPALRTVATTSPESTNAPANAQTKLAPPRPAHTWAGVPPVASSRPKGSGTRQAPGIAIAGVVAVIAVVGAVAAVALSKGGSTPPQTTAPAAVNATASDPAGWASPGVADGQGGPGLAKASASAQATIQAKPATATGQWLNYGSIPAKLWGNGAVQLPSGNVAIFSASGSNLQTATTATWLFDPQVGATTAGPTMAASQSVPAIATFGDGSAMIAGGWKDSVPTAAAEILDGATGQFVPIPPMSMPRSHATATDIGNGRVLVVGGWINLNAGVYTATSSAEIFDRSTGAWSPAASMSTPRALATATKLQDGRVLVAGGDLSWQGSDNQGATQTVLKTAEIYDPGANTWQSAGELSAPRAAASAALLPNGHVLVTGGWSDGREYGLATTDEYTPGSGWARGSDMPTPHAQSRLAVLKDGRLLAVGGVDGAGMATAETDLYDPSSRVWQRSGNLLQPLYWSSVAVLSDGRVLAVGGADDAGTANGQIEIYAPPTK